MTTATLRLSSPFTAPRTAPRKGLVTRFYEALLEARLRQAMREIAMHRHLVPDDILKGAGYQATLANDGALPFTR